MRIPFPERIPIGRVATFAVVLFVIQRLEGTALYFSAGCAAFILIAAFAFNTAGGLTRASGAYVFFYSLLVVIIGICYKAYLGEPGDSNLLDPRTTIEVYVAGIAAMLGTVIISRRFSRKTGLLQNVLKVSDMYRASVGCIVFAIAGPLLLSLLGENGRWLGTAFAQLNRLIPLGIIVGVMYEIRRSGGTRSINLPIVLGAAYAFVIYGLLTFGKEGMLTPLYCWFVPVWALRFRLSMFQVASCLLGAFIVFYYLVPYSQYGRSFREARGEKRTLSQKIAVSEKLLEHPDETRRMFEQDEANDQKGALGEYYNKPQGFWDRLQFVSVDDSLINITDQGKVFGLMPITASFLNAIPHVFWPNKPNLNFGNTYTHEYGTESEDTTTGISFSATAEAYHMARWVGVLLVAPLIWFLVFVVFDSLFGDLRVTPWGLLVLVGLAHTAPEGALTGAIYFLTFGVETLVFCAFFTAWVAPIFAITVLGPDRRRFARQLSFRLKLAPRLTQ